MNSVKGRHHRRFGQPAINVYVAPDTAQMMVVGLVAGECVVTSPSCQSTISTTPP
ncbi:hypothetical protein [Streptomyces sp. NPDC048188]|uniref:hypothetical protein n=1 Tax=unclassified Streptomyces TaxID=2593676 RepID=UPI0034198046